MISEIFIWAIILMLSFLGGVMTRYGYAFHGGALVTVAAVYFAAYTILGPAAFLVP